MTTVRTLSRVTIAGCLLAMVLPGGQAILVSEYGGMEGYTPGRLSLLVLDAEELSTGTRGLPWVPARGWC